MPKLTPSNPASQRLPWREFKRLVDDSYGGPLANVTGMAYELHLWPGRDRDTVLVVLIANGPVGDETRTYEVWTFAEGDYVASWKAALTFITEETTRDIRKEYGL